MKFLGFPTLVGVLLLGAFLLNSCATKSETDNLQLAGNRKMAMVLKGISRGEKFVSERPLINYLLPLARKAIMETYQSDIEYMSLEGGRLLQSPDNLYKIAANGVDDLLLVTIQVPEDFQIPQPATPGMGSMEERSPEEQSLINESRRVLLNIDVVNGANLNTAARVRSSTAYSSKEKFEANFLENFRVAAGQSWPNPNIYPRSDPLYFANLLFDYSQEKEKKSEVALNCDVADEYLEYYSKAAELFERAKASMKDEVVAQQEKMHELNIRIDESSRKSGILEKCRVDASLKFKLDVEIVGIGDENADFIRQAVVSSKIEPLLAKYTDKPVTIRFSSTSDGGVQIDLYIRYHSDRYTTWLSQLQVPSIYRGYHVLSLKPYEALMKTMVYLRSRVPGNAPVPLQRGFRTASMRIHLDTLMNGQVAFGVNGRFLEKEKAVDLFSPNGILLSLENFEKETVFTRSEEIFQDKGWISLSSCKTLEGNLTQDGIIMKFFELPCKI